MRKKNQILKERGFRETFSSTWSVLKIILQKIGTRLLTSSHFEVLAAEKNI